MLDRVPLERVRSFLDRHTYVEPGWGIYDPSHRDVAAPVVYKGYFQREEYFLDAADDVARGFHPIPATSTEAIGHARALFGARPTVSLHLRAGADYVRLGWDPRYEWFRRAAEAMVDRVGEVGFVTASDVPLVAEAMGTAFSDLGPSLALVDLPPFDTLRAIGLADHAIVSPSTFSWWAAWLGDHRVDFDPARVVMAPQTWIDPDMQPASTRWHQVR